MIILLCIMYMWHVAHNDFVRFDVLEHEKLPQAFNGYKIFFIADVHRRKIRQQTLEKVNCPIDMVCIGGDLLERGVPLQRVRTNIQLLKKWGAPIYFVWGNNDFEVDIEQFTALLHEEGVVILEDTTIQIKRSHEIINVVGFSYVDIETGMRNAVDWELLNREMTLLLTHKPVSYDTLLEDKQAAIDIVLTGHTHGGQIRIANFGFYTSGGIKKRQKSIVLTTEGYGYSLLPFRLGTTAECHVLTLGTPTYNP